MKKLLLIPLAAILVIGLLVFLEMSKDRPNAPADPVDNGTSQNSTDVDLDVGADDEEEPDGVIDFDDLLNAAEDAQNG